MALLIVLLLVGLSFFGKIKRFAFILVLGWAGAVLASATRYTLDWKDVHLDGTSQTASSNRVFILPKTDSLIVEMTGAAPFSYQGRLLLGHYTLSSPPKYSAGMNTKIAEDYRKYKTTSCKTSSTMEYYLYTGGDIILKAGPDFAYYNTTQRMFASPGFPNTFNFSYNSSGSPGGPMNMWPDNVHLCGGIQASFNGSIDIYLWHVNGNADSTACVLPTKSKCLECAYPYQSEPDSVGCGCTVHAGQYQSKSSLYYGCSAYCNSTSISGNQAYFDQSRSNFDQTKGSILCACSDKISAKTIYRPADKCPVGTALTESSNATDTGLQSIVFDPSAVPDSVRNGTGSGSGSGGGTGEYDSSMDHHLRRIDSILGSGGDTGLWDKYHDSLKYYGNGVDSVLAHDTGALRGKNNQALGDTSNNYNWIHSDGQSGNPNATYYGQNIYSCSDYPDIPIYLNYQSLGINRIDTLKIGFNGNMTPYLPYLRIIELLASIAAGFGIFMYIAGGSTGKDSV